MHEFAYCFAIDGKVEWSAETTQTLLRRLQEDERNEAEDFLATAQPGHHINLSSGALIFCTAEPFH